MTKEAIINQLREAAETYGTRNYETGRSCLEDARVWLTASWEHLPFPTAWNHNNDEIEISYRNTKGNAKVKLMGQDRAWYMWLKGEAKEFNPSNPGEAIKSIRADLGDDLDPLEARF